MHEVSAPVVAIALVLAAVFVPTAFVPGITGRMYQQFALTIAVSVLISAFNALTLSPALSGAAPAAEAARCAAPLGWFFRGFNRVFEQVMGGYLDGSHFLIRKAAFAILLLLVVAAVSASSASGFQWFRPRGRTRATFYVNAQLPLAASLERYGGRHGQARRHPQGHAGRQVLHGRGRLQPAERRVHDVQPGSTSSAWSPGISGTRRGSPPTYIIRGPEPAAGGRFPPHRPCVRAAAVPASALPAA